MKPPDPTQPTRISTPGSPLQTLEQELASLAAVMAANPSQQQALAAQLADLHRQVAALRAASAEPTTEAWRRVELARHPQRPQFLDWVRGLCQDFAELHGDRRFGDDGAIIAGMARFRDRQVLLVGQQRGRDVKEKIRRNFGSPQPEGYRKALRLMQLAAKFQRPILSFIDTAGAYPGVEAEERGQAEAIAFNLREMARLNVPVLCTVTGEGGSGGALAIALGNRVLMLENAVYSVISPEGCASIMWRDSTKKALAAEALKPTAAEMLELGLIDGIVAEPPGGAHSDPESAFRLLGDALEKQFQELDGMPTEALRQQRYERLRRLGSFFSE